MVQATPSITRFVNATTGNDGSNGTQAAPFKRSPVRFRALKQARQFNLPQALTALLLVRPFPSKFLLA
jgi:hypothetical protein